MLTLPTTNDYWFRSCSVSLQEALFARLGVRDLVDHKSNAAFGDNVGNAIANLDTYDSFCSGDTKHWEQVNDGVCAPTDNSHLLCNLDLPCDNWVSFAGCCKTNEQLVHNVQEECHRGKPAHPTRREVTSHDELTVVTRDNHEGRTRTENPIFASESLLVELHHQQDLNQEQRHREQPIHVTVGIVERNASQFWAVALLDT